MIRASLIYGSNGYLCAIPVQSWEPFLPATATGVSPITQNSINSYVIINDGIWQGDNCFWT